MSGLLKKTQSPSRSKRSLLSKGWDWIRSFVGKKKSAKASKKASPKSSPKVSKKSNPKASKKSSKKASKKSSKKASPKVSKKSSQKVSKKASKKSSKKSSPKVSKKSSPKFDEYRYQYKLLTGGKYYFINESVYFLHVSGNKAHLCLKNNYRFFEDESDECQDKIIEPLYSRVVTEFFVEKVFADEEPRKYRWQPGSSVLLKIAKNLYIHVSKQVIMFETDEEILSFYSPVGDRCVPYPVAVGKLNIYCLWDLHVVDKQMFYESKFYKTNISEEDNIIGFNEWVDDEIREFGYNPGKLLKEVVLLQRNAYRNSILKWNYCLDDFY